MASKPQAADSTAPPQHTVQEEKDARQKWRESDRNDERGPSPDFTALIDAVSREAQANREQESREDRGKRFREFLTLIFVMATAAGVFYQAWIFSGQLDEMRRTYGPIESQANAATKSAEALMTAERPYLLPQTITIKGVKGTPDENGLVQLTFDYTFTNFGRSPLFLGNVSLNFGPVLPEQPEYAFPINDRFILAVGTTYHTIGGLKTPKAVADKIASRETIIYIFGYIEYTDIFSNPHKTCFAYKMIFENADISKNFLPSGPSSYWCYS